MSIMRKIYHTLRLLIWKLSWTEPDIDLTENSKKSVTDFTKE